MDSRKNSIEAGLPKKREAWTVCSFKRAGLGTKEGVAFLSGGGGLIPQCTLTGQTDMLVKLQLSKKFLTH